MVGAETPKERANSAALNTFPFQCANIIQNRRMAFAVKSMPKAGKSRSMKVAIYAFRQAMLSAFVLAKKERGKPPRNHKRWALLTSNEVKGGNSK